MLKIFLTAFILIFYVSHAVDNGLGRTPPMGWNSWNGFGCEINETLIRNTADRIIELGLDKKGYNYINLDDCWQISRDLETGEIIEDLKNFPSGIGALSKYIHQKGLKFGLYSDAGEKTCQLRPGSYGYEKIDAATYTKWEVDYLKYDNCNHPEVSSKLRYYAMYKALNSTGRPIFFSICNWGEEKVWEWGSQYGNSWRTTLDILDKWPRFLELLEKNVGLEKYAGPGGWNDPDMLQVGNGGMTHNEYYAHFALWCALKAPLLIGCDLVNITNQTLQILGNEQLIAINQDSLGIQAKRIKQQVTKNYKRQVWGGPLQNNKYVIIFFNKGQSSTTISVSLKKQLHLDYSTYTQRDPIRHKDIASAHKDIIQEKVDPHSVQVRILTINKHNSIYNLHLEQ